MAQITVFKIDGEAKQVNCIGGQAGWLSFQIIEKGLVTAVHKVPESVMTPGQHNFRTGGSSYSITTV